MSRILLTRLVLPLVGIFAGSIAVHLYWSAGGFFINVAAGIFCTLVTVCYVDWTLRRHERERWQSTDTRIANRLRVFLNATVSGIRDGIGFGPEILGDLSPYDPITIHRAAMIAAEGIIAPALEQRIKALDQVGWESLARQIQNSHNGLLSFFAAFQARLAPEQIALLLDLQESLSQSVTYWNTFPDVMGVPEDQLPPKKTPGQVLQAEGCALAATALRKSLGLAKKLSATLRDQLPQQIASAE